MQCIVHLCSSDESSLPPLQCRPPVTVMLTLQGPATLRAKCACMCCRVHHCHVCACALHCTSLLSASCRVHVNTISRAVAGSPEGLSTGLMACSQLRRGCQCHTVHSVLYVAPPQGRLDSANNAGQVNSAKIPASPKTIPSALSVRRGGNPLNSAGSSMPEVTVCC